MGDQGQGAASQLLRLPHPGLHHQSRQLQRGGDLCAVQEPPAHGNNLLYTSRSSLLLLKPNRHAEQGICAS